MKRKLLKLSFLLLLILIAAVYLLNRKYPFVTLEGGPWSVGFSSSSQPLENISIVRDGVITYEYIDSLTPGKTFYIADPFFIKEKDTFFLFVEQKGENNANIALLTSKDGRDFKYKGIVMDEDFHLSYPQVFRYRDEIYMLPETKGANQVLLYKAENFPYNWIVDDTLLKNRSLKDPSLLLSENFNLIVAADDELKQYFFTADSLKGEWKEVRNYKQRWGNETRPGGRFFRYEEHWYLPVQNRSRGYGTGISLYKLKNEDDYFSLEQTHPLILGPQEINWFNRGMHHLDLQNFNDQFYMAYDGDRNLHGKKEFQYKRTVKLALLDLYNLFQ